MPHKTKVLTLIVFGLLFLNLSAQEDNFENDPVAKLPNENRTFRFGLQFSPNLSWMKANTTGYQSEGTKFGFSYGLSFEYFISNNYLFSTGITMLSSGGKLSYKGTTISASNASVIRVNIKETYNLKYVEIPLILKLRTNEIGYLTYFGKFGLNAGFNYRAKGEYVYSIPNTIGTFEATENISEDINFINLSLVIGAGVEYNISGNTSLTCGLTFNNGFINQLDSKVHLLDGEGDAIIDSSGNPVYSEKDASANLNYIALNLGIYF